MASYFRMEITKNSAFVLILGFSHLPAPTVNVSKRSSDPSADVAAPSHGTPASAPFPAPGVPGSDADVSNDAVFLGDTVFVGDTVTQLLTKSLPSTSLISLPTNRVLTC